MTAPTAGLGPREGRIRALHVAAAIAAVAACGVAVLVVRDGAAFARGHGSTGVALDLAADVALLVAGIIALIRRRPFALIVLASGCSWAIAEWLNPAAPGGLVFTAGLLLGAAWIPLVGWLALAFPGARPGRRRERASIAVGFFATLAPAFVYATAFDPSRSGCDACPRNLLLIVGDAAVAGSVARGAQLLGILACALFIWMAIARLHAASPAQRILIAPVAAASVVALTAAALGSAAAVFAGIPGIAFAQTATTIVSAGLVALAIAVSWEIVRIATARRRSAQLAADLATAADPGALRRELAAITRDDSLELLFPVGDRMVDAAGRATSDPRLTGDGMRRVTPAVGRDGAELAVLAHRPGLLDDLDFRDAVTRAAGLALEHERLQAELALRVADLRESRALLVESFDRERRRLERDLHDGAQQQMVALLLVLRLAAAQHPHPRLDEAIGDVDAALEELRTLAHGIFPAALAEEGLGAALGQLREAATIPIRLHSVPDGRWPDSVETTAYLVIAETLRSGGMQAAVVDVADDVGALRISVSGARGSGNAPDAFADEVAGLIDRVGAVGGDMRIEDDLGVLTVQAVLPCGS
ncbi:histidine kinase [Microbacterium sp. AZCO]|uniref:histidine kinase n=1 Tax=Microbacterium sp. AZCO TaxID=3142976 RepID=UPI0031F46F6D